MSNLLYYGQLVMGPAGSGKSTYCKVVQEMSQMLGRKMFVINLDPAAEQFSYKCDLDIRDLITVDDVMEEMKLGPNGGLVYCMEYLIKNFDWFEEQISESVRQDDYVLIDCPGQIELYIFYDVFRQLVDRLVRSGWSLCSMYIVDVTLLQDQVKWISGILAAISAMSNIPLPHLTILSKCDLIQDKELLNSYVKDTLEMEDVEWNLGTKKELNIFGLNEKVSSAQQKQKQNPLDKKYAGLNQALIDLVINYSNINLMKLDLSRAKTIRKIIYQADMMIQYGENLEPNDKLYDQQMEQEDYIQE